MSKIIHNGVEKVEIFVFFSNYKDAFTSDFYDVSLVLDDLIEDWSKWTQLDEGTWRSDDGCYIHRYLRRHWMTELS